MVKKAAAKKKKKLSPDEARQQREQKAHQRLVQSAFENAGFSRVAAVSDKEFTYHGTTSDFDDVFVLENVVVLAEYTLTKESEISKHIKPKKILYDKIATDPGAFVTFLAAKHPSLAKALGADYTPYHFRVVIMYCSKNVVKPSLKAEVPGVKYLDYEYLLYFKLLTDIVKLSSRYELLDFLGITPKDFGAQVLKVSALPRDEYPGSLLPESSSKFPPGYKVVSFYADPGALLVRAYVLRRDGWRGKSTLYQRMIGRQKVASIRRHLLDKSTVFINNIIVTLPETTKLLDASASTVDPATLTSTAPITVSIPSGYDSIGLIDGQHRLYAYHEGGASDEKIGPLRLQQNLLVTGIIYPSGTTDDEKAKFEASLFLEINANQTNARSDLKQSIGMIIRPFDAESIAREVVNGLNEGAGPLMDQFERSMFDKGGLKTTSVVTYGVRPLVKLSGSDSLFKIWKGDQKAGVLAGTDYEGRKAYIAFCISRINEILAAYRKNVGNARWTRDKSVANRVLTPTIINGMLISARHANDAGVDLSFASLDPLLAGSGEFDFGKYRSSGYTIMGRDLYKKYLAGGAVGDS